VSALCLHRRTWIRILSRASPPRPGSLEADRDSDSTDVELLARHATRAPIVAVPSSHVVGDRRLDQRYHQSLEVEALDDIPSHGVGSLISGANTDRVHRDTRAVHAVQLREASSRSRLGPGGATEGTRDRLQGKPISP
jgi:hypothetical protein